MTLPLTLRAPPAPAVPARDGAAPLPLAGAGLLALPSGALWWEAEGLLAVADLHLGRSERLARRGGALLPPYESEDTLSRLERLVVALAPAHVLCLGDSFDDGAAARALPVPLARRLAQLAEDRRWTWIAGNHDPRPPGLPGAHAEALALGPLRFRHIAAEAPPGPGEGEVSAHYHPKARLHHRGRRICRPAFLSGAGRLVLPAFGTYTGGLDARDPLFAALLGPAARVHLTGRRIVTLPRAALA